MKPEEVKNFRETENCSNCIHSAHVLDRTYSCFYTIENQYVDEKSVCDYYKKKYQNN